jgi:FkbM family methyltransferase
VKGKKFNKQVANTVRFIYRLGLIKALLIFITVFAAAEEYKVKWKGRQVHLRKGTSDFCVFRQVLVFDQYTIKGLKSEEVETIVDLGANIGLSVLFFKVKYPKARIIAVEPEIKNYDLMVKNTTGLPDIYCLNNAIWHSNKTLGIFDTGGGEYNYLVKEESEDEKAVTRSITINDIIEKHQLSRIDLLKIDIEGSEKELFSGNYTSWLPKVGCIVIEVHDWFRPGCAAAFFRAISLMEYTMSFKGENITIIFDKDKKELNTNEQIETGNQTLTSIGYNYNLPA